MSLINRMLADLEGRGAPKPRGGDQAIVPERRSRRRYLAGRALSLTLAVVLVVIAVALWSVRGDRVFAMWQSVAGADATEAAASAPELIGLAFEGDRDRPRLALQLSERPHRTPRYRRSGSSASLALSARAHEVMVPAPPAQQEVFRGLLLETGGDGRMRVRLEIAPGAELDLQVSGKRIVLRGHLPAGQDPADSELDPVSGSGRVADRGDAAGSEASAHAATGSREGSAPEIGTGEEASEVAEVERQQETQTLASAASDDDDGIASAQRSVPSADGSESPSARSTSAAARAETGSDAIAGEIGAAQAEPTAATSDSVAASARDAGAASAPATPASEPTSREAGSARTARAGADGTDTRPSTVRKTQSLPPETRARRRYREARQALTRGELGPARRLLTQALELDPVLHPARDLLVGLWRRAGDATAARRLLEEGIALAPERVEYAMPYARLLVDTGELDRAARVLARARTAGNGNAGFHALAAAVAQRRGRHEQAATEYTRALEADARNGLWWLGLGISLAATDRTEEARSALREARASGDLSETLDRWAAGRIDALESGSEG